ncbi:MAG: ATP-binding protein [Pseudomonadota bacterium]|nr:ATP-binding protein [Pseudomonadota bacterium]
MVSPYGRLMVAVIVLALSTLANANGVAACEAAAQTLEQLQQEKQQQQARLQQFNAILAGQVATPEQLTELLGHPLEQRQLLPQPQPVPRSVPDNKCDALQNDIDTLVSQLSRQDRQLHALHEKLDALTFPQRQAFASLAAQHQQLRALILAADTPEPARLAATTLSEHIRQAWGILPRLADAPEQALQQLDALWFESPALTPPPQPSSQWRDLLRTRLSMQSALRQLRADLWQRHSLWQQIQAMGGPTQVPALLQHETRRISQRLLDTAHVIDLDLQESSKDKRYLPLVQNSVALILGIAGFMLLVRLARRTRHWALTLHESVVRASGERRWLRNASRLIRGIAPILPWVLLWLILEQLGPYLDTPSTRILLWLLPVARLYVIYGLLNLIGEWLVIRVAQSANAYLSSDQSRQVHDHARVIARWLMLPWLPLLVVWESLGPSLLYYLCLGVLLVAIYWGLGRLLALRSRDYQLCLQAILPSRLDPLAEALLTPGLFWLFAPLLLPVALASFLVGFVDRVLADFDWYMRFKARLFRLRTRINNEESDDDGDDQPVSEHYERWFASLLPEGSKTPFIDTGLVTAMEKNIQRWHEGKTDDNAQVVVGEKGCGKTVSVDRLEKALAESCDGLNLIKLTVPAKTTEPNTILALIGDALAVDLSDGPAALVKSDEQRQPTLVVLDEAQNFFLKTIGGLEGWRTLLSLVNARLDNVFWLLMVNNQSWAYLCNVFGRDYQFRNVLKVKRWGQTDIRSLILARNHLSGHRVRYDEVLLSSRGPEAGNVRNAEQRYFSLLWDACRGNPMVALRLWLTSVKPQGRQVLVGLPTPPSASLLDGMGENALFVYAAIATHENLTAQEIASVTSLADNVVRYALKGGFDAGFLNKSEDGRYRLKPLWYQQVISYLTRKNLLNE